MKKLVVHLTEDHHRKLEALANIDGSSMSHQVRESLAYRFKARSKELAKELRENRPLKERKKTNEGASSAPASGARRRPASGEEIRGAAPAVVTMDEARSILAKRDAQRLELYERHVDHAEQAPAEGCPWCMDPRTPVPETLTTGKVQIATPIRIVEPGGSQRLS